MFPQSSCGRHPKLRLVAWVGNRLCRQTRCANIASFWAGGNSFKRIWTSFALNVSWAWTFLLSLPQEKYGWSYILKESAIVQMWSWLFSFILWSQTLSEMKIFSWYFLCKYKLEGVTLSDSWVSGSHGVDGHEPMRHNWIICSLISFPPHHAKPFCVPWHVQNLFSYSSKVATVVRKAPLFLWKICLNALESDVWFGFGWLVFTCQAMVNWSNGLWFRTDSK